MIYDITFSLGGAFAFYNIGERSLGRIAAKTPCFPPAEVILHAAIERFAEYFPGFPGRTRYDGYIRKFVFGILRSISPSQCLYQAYHLTPFFPTTLRNSGTENMR